MQGKVGKSFGEKHGGIEGFPWENPQILQGAWGPFIFPCIYFGILYALPGGPLTSRTTL